MNLQFFPLGDHSVAWSFAWHANISASLNICAKSDGYDVMSRCSGRGRMLPGFMSFFVVPQRISLFLSFDVSDYFISFDFFFCST